MTADSLDSPSGKARKRLPAKAVTRQSIPKLKTTVHFEAETLKRLDTHALMMEMDRSELLSHLVNKHLRRYVVSDRGGEESTPGGDAAA